MFKWNTWATKKCYYNFKVILYDESAKQKTIFLRFYTISNKGPCNHLTKGHLQEFSDEWFTNSCYYKRVFPKNGLGNGREYFHG